MCHLLSKEGSMRIVFVISILFFLFIVGCTAPVKISGYPGEEAGNYSKEECKSNLNFGSVKVLGSLPKDGTYIELGYMSVSQESSSELVYTSEEKQIKEARIKACQWGADAIVIMGSQNNKGSDFWTGWKDKRETKIIAIKYK